MANRRSRIKGIANIPQRRPQPESTNDVCTISECNKQLTTDEIVVANPKPTSENKCIAGINSDVTIFASSRKRTFTESGPSIIESKPSNGENTTSSLETKTVASNAIHKNSEVANEIVDKPQIKEIEPTKTGVKVLNEIPFVKPSFSLRAQKQNPVSSYEGGDPLLPVSDSESTKTINRSRIKAIPRFNNRRLSVTLQHGSASESEDDVKRVNQRARTDSSTAPPSSKQHETSVQKHKEFSSIVQKKCRRSDQSRKMAEARREFNNKFGKSLPDKQKLTMMDLIFYNPASNPMSQKLKKSKKKQEQDEEKEDDLPAEVSVQKDEEKELPTPRIKIGLDGEIVVDEQSLVIENAALKRGREELEKSEVVDGDLETSYGVYKRVKRSKDWTNEDTMLFYRALNTLGTDFTLMTQLFPERTRKELKMKFKKEERVNANLIDKALTRPVQFNIMELKEEIRNREKVAKLKTKRSEKIMLHINDNIPYVSSSKSVRYRCGNRSQQKDSCKKEQRAGEKSSVLGIKKFLVFSDDEEEELSNSNCSDDTPNVVNDNPNTDLPPSQNMQALEPGSLMILASTTPTGLPQMKVFMVTSSTIDSFDKGVTNNPGLASKSVEQN